MKLPKEREIIPIAPLKYIDLEAIFNHYLTERLAKINGYISVTYPDEQAFLFLKKGELFSSGRITGNEFQKTSMMSVLKKMKSFQKKEEAASLSFCEMDENLFKCLLNKFYVEPKYRNLNTKFTDVKKLFDTILKMKYNGFIEFIYKNSINFIIVENGELSHVYFCDELQPYLEEALKSNDISILLSTLVHLFDKEEAGGYINVFNKATDVPAQLSPYIVDLMEKIIMKTVEVIGKEHSAVNLIKYFEGGLDKVAAKYPEIKNAKIKKDDADLSGVELPMEDFVVAVAMLFNEFIDKLNLVFPGTAVMKIFDTLKDFRFVLENAKFFEKSYMKSLL